jgi:hypothetical protein
MRYGELVSRSWTIWWRYRYLWLLGALGGGETVGAGGFGFSFPQSPSGFGGRGENGARPEEFVHWVEVMLPLLLILGALLVLFAIAYFFVSCVTTGAVIRGVAEHDAQRPFGLGPAWQAGRQTFLPILGLRLLLVLFVLAVLAIFGALFFLGAASAQAGQGAGVALAIVIGIPLVIAAVLAAIALGIVVAIALRAIVLEQRGVFPALGRGFSLLFGRRMGRVLLVWLLEIALGFGVGLATSVAAFLIGLALFIIGLLVFAGLGLFAALTAGSILLFLFVIALVLIGGAASSYLSAYWTVAFRRLEIDVPPAPAYYPYPQPSPQQQPPPG